MEKTTGLSQSSSTSIPVTIEGKLEAARTLKQEGNEFFKKKEWRKAISKYHRSKLYCKGMVDSLDSIPGLEAASGREKPTESQKSEATQIMIALSNNLAACLSHTEKWERVIQNTNEVLKLESGNCKALYRRGVARLHLGLLDEAEEDLTTARSLNPKDKNIVEQLQELQRLKKDHIEKEKIMYQAMFKT